MFSTPEMTAVFSDTAHLAALLSFQAALARALAQCGLAPRRCADAIVAACRADAFSISALAAAGARGGSVVIPLVKALTEHVAKASPEAAGFVHLGATSQDVIDTALVLQMRRGCDLLESELSALQGAVGRLAREHGDTIMLGRTLLQPGLPMTFGLKAAGWLGALDRCAARLAQARADALVLQFGGAVGTLSALGARGLDVAEALAADLALPLPPAPWHTGHDAFAALACDIAILVGALGKISRDIALMMQFEVGEVAEPGGAGRGGSSTMPHKRNPTASMLALAAAHRAPGLAATMLNALPQEAERGLGNWQSEWVTAPQLFHAAASALAAMNEAVGGLRVFPDRMRANLDRLDGLTQAEAVSVALAGALGRERAHHLVDEAVTRAATEGQSLRSALEADPDVIAHLPPERLDALFDPSGALGMASVFVDRVLCAHPRRGDD